MSLLLEPLDGKRVLKLPLGDAFLCFGKIHESGFELDLGSRQLVLQSRHLLGQALAFLAVLGTGPEQLPLNIVQVDHQLVDVFGPRLATGEVIGCLDRIAQPVELFFQDLLVRQLYLHAGDLTEGFLELFLQI